jgi:hypothetical protein
MVADTRGNLYVISANHYVFKVNIETRLASFVTRLNDIPATYSVNGAAVDEEGNLILGSANSTDGFYKVNPVNWKVDKLQNAGEKLNVSDLASSYFLFDNRNTKTTQTFNDIREVYNEKIAAYPNPVTEAVIKVSFDQLPKGKYAMDLVDLTGRLLTSKNITVTAASQLETIMLDSKAAKGLYLLRVTNNDQKIVFVKKMFVQ